MDGGDAFKTSLSCLIWLWRLIMNRSSLKPWREVGTLSPSSRPEAKSPSSLYFRGKIFHPRVRNSTGRKKKKNNLLLQPFVYICWSCYQTQKRFVALPAIQSRLPSCAFCLQTSSICDLTQAHRCPAAWTLCYENVEKTEYWCSHEKLAAKQVNFSSEESLVNSTTSHAK